MQQLVELDEVGMIEGIPVRGAGDADNDDVLGPEMIVDGDDAVDNGDAVVNDMGEDAIDMLFGDEPNRSRQLRCLIAKRFSNEVSHKLRAIRICAALIYALIATLFLIDGRQYCGT